MKNEIPKMIEMDVPRHGTIMLRKYCEGYEKPIMKLTLGFKEKEGFDHIRTIRHKKDGKYWYVTYVK